MRDAPKAHLPHRLNVVGDFYVAEGCCTACGVPEANAPELFAYDTKMHCYVRRQPATPGELDRMLSVVASQELQCIRYRGSDVAVIARIDALGEGAQIDRPTSRVEWPLFAWFGLVLRRLLGR